MRGRGAGLGLGRGAYFIFCLFILTFQVVFILAK